jgi:hypothetical protein
MKAHIQAQLPAQPIWTSQGALPLAQLLGFNAPGPGESVRWMTAGLR